MQHAPRTPRLSSRIIANPRFLTAAAVSLCALLPMRSASANPILDAVNTSIARATQARDRATEARDVATTARDVATTARNNAAAARDSATEVRDNIREGVQALSSQMRDVISDAIEDGNRMIQEELEGRDAFINGPQCPAFRNRLVQLLQQMETLLNTLSSIATPQGPGISFQREIQLLQALPCRGLFPLHRVTSATDFVSQSLLDNLTQTNAALAAVAPIVRDDFRSPSQSSSTTYIEMELNLGTNQHILMNSASVRENNDLVSLGGVLCQTTGTILKALGTTAVAKEIDFAFAGYLGASIQADPLMKLGLFFSGVGEALGQISNVVTGKYRYAMTVGMLSELRDNQKEILRRLDSAGSN